MSLALFVVLAGSFAARAQERPAGTPPAGMTLVPAGRSTPRFRGSGSEGAKDTANFPAFMCYGFRRSLKASYTVHNLGFRCARSLDQKDK